MEVQEVEKQIIPQGYNRLNLNVRNSSAQKTHFLNQKVTRGSRERGEGEKAEVRRKKGEGGRGGRKEKRSQKEGERETGEEQSFDRRDLRPM